MNLAELSSPIRIYWDIGAAQDVPSADHRRIAEEIALNKVLSLQLTDTAPRLSESTLSIIEWLAAKPLALSLVAVRSAIDTPVRDHLKQHGVKALFIQSFSVTGLEAVPPVTHLAAGKPAVGAAFPVTRETMGELPEVLSFCIAQRIEHLLLPMQRLSAGGSCFSFSREERTELTARLGKIEKPSWLKITVHDPFLWRAFYPNVEFPNGGCQAANTMLYIDPGFDVYPCPMLPVKLGNLLDGPLKDIIRSEQKGVVRRDILKRASACETCGETDACKGGCRGRALVMEGSLEQPDPACR